MVQLFGQEFTRSDLLQRIGDVSQIAGVRTMRLEGGRGAGHTAGGPYDVKDAAEGLKD